VKLCPNGRIPVIVDRDNDDFAVFESGPSSAAIERDHKECRRLYEVLDNQLGGPVAT